ncbi:MAG: DUF1573 domain-containing protein [Cyclobacteriaceae bacterium]|nr:DUF1573 domain-containing protein [Cyclobacteriaceae bacterium]MCH8514857.1 DUF1573 domain-containing protein [Cyclobacteriaceae bacterium]
MKKGLLLFAIAIFVFGFAQAQDEASGAKIVFAEELHDFGDIYQGDRVSHVFKYKNEGTEPLIITNVMTTCGCTASKYKKNEPIAPGEEGEITVNFNSAGKIGIQNKTVTIVSNASNNRERVRIKTNILPKKES